MVLVNVVEAVVRAFVAKNFTTLRFNFRGVGASTGNYDEGEGESRDIIAAYQYLKQGGLPQVYFAGYSFGAWVGAKTMETHDKIFSYSIFISPPNNYFAFNFKSIEDKLDLIIYGDKDKFSDIGRIKKQIKKIDITIEKINGADHFYWGKEKEIEDILGKNIVK